MIMGKRFTENDRCYLRGAGSGLAEDEEQTPFLHATPDHDLMALLQSTAGLPSCTLTLLCTWQTQTEKSYLEAVLGGFLEMIAVKCRRHSAHGYRLAKPYMKSRAAFCCACVGFSG